MWYDKRSRTTHFCSASSWKSSVLKGATPTSTDDNEAMLSCLARDETPGVGRPVVTTLR